MRRRSFLYGMLAITSLSKINPAWCFTPVEKELLPNTINHVNSGAILKMPALPNNGDYVQLIVDRESLLRNATLIGNGSSILEEQELVLDQMAIVKFVYDKQTSNWVLG